MRAGPGMNWVRQRALCSLYFFVAECWLERGELGRRWPPGGRSASAGSARRICM